MFTRSVENFFFCCDIFSALSGFFDFSCVSNTIAASLSPPSLLTSPLLSSPLPRDNRQWQALLWQSVPPTWSRPLPCASPPCRTFNPPATSFARPGRCARMASSSPSSASLAVPTPTLLLPLLPPSRRSDSGSCDGPGVWLGSLLWVSRGNWPTVSTTSGLPLSRSSPTRPRKLWSFWVRCCDGLLGFRGDKKQAC